MRKALTAILLFPMIVFSQVLPPGKYLKVKDDGTGFELFTLNAILNSDTTTKIISKYKSDSIHAALTTLIGTKAASNHNHTGVYQPTGSYLATSDSANMLNGYIRKNLPIGYTSGQGGTITQATNKSTGVTLNKLSGEITMNNAALAAAAIVSFTITNSAIAATDVIILNHVTTGTRGAYTLNAQCAAGSAVIYVRNNTAGSLGEAIVIRYTVIKGTIN